MKRSQVLTLVVLGGSLGACESNESNVEALVYRSVAHCQSDQKLNLAECEQSRNTALSAHLLSAPKFRSLADCEAEFIECDPPIAHYQPMPTMRGFIVQDTLQQRVIAAQLSQPVYRLQSGALTTGGGINVPDGIRVSVPRAAFDTPSHAQTYSRGGFGDSARRAASYGSYGS
jgi:uncharacterized protein YgiB involved in biofilm formation